MGNPRKGTTKTVAPLKSHPENPVAVPLIALRKSRYVWMFRLAALAFPLICVGVVEFSLRMAGKGIDPTLVIRSKRNPSGKEYYFNPRVDVTYCKFDLRGPEPRGFALPRPTDLFRVIVVGESSVQGYPYPSELAFPRQMELVLQRQLDSKRIEVLNAGIIGIGSLPLSDMVQQCAAADPSAIVVYAGHNEFYGVGGVATNASLSPIAIPLRKTRLIQWLSDGDSPATDQKRTSNSPLISRMPKEVQIPPSSPLVNQALENFRSRMHGIAEFCTRRRIPLLLCSPVSNLRSQSPWSSTELSLALKHVERKIRAPLSSATSGDYLVELRSQITAHPDDALLQYRMAQCLELAGNQEDAVRSYVNARDLDQCRYRAPSTFRKTLDGIADKFSSHVSFLDLEPIFREHCGGGTPGDELFLEHVHFTIEGHWLMAQSISKKIMETQIGQQWTPTRVPSDSERDEWLGLIPEDQLVAFNLASFIGDEPPFNQALDAKQHVAALKAKIGALESSLPQEQLKRFRSLHNAVKTDDLIDGLGRISLSWKDPQHALEYFERSTRRRPWMPNGFLFCAMALQMSGDTSQVCDYLRKSKTSVIEETARLLKDRERLEKVIRCGDDRR